MKFLVHYDHVSFNAVQRRTIELDCEGDGTKDNPIIIEPSGQLPNIFIIHRSNLYVKIRNCENSILLLEVQNITIENCKSRWILVMLSSNVTLKDCQIRKFLRLRSCSNVTVEDCKITKIQFYDSSKNIIRNCIISKEIELSESEDNIIQNNIYSDIMFDKRIRKKTKHRSLKPLNSTYPYWIIISIIFIIIVSIWFDLVLLVIFSSILITALILEIQLRKSLKKKLRNKGKELDNKENIKF